MVQLAKDDRTLQRTLEARLNVDAPAVDLVVATRQAIVDATDFDERRINCNFDYDYQAYETVKRNLKHLIKDGQWTEAMELSVELMKSGSYQVEMSDEGMMTDDIQECLQSVIKILRKSGLAAKDVRDWCSTMLKMDSVGFICDEELTALENSVADS